MHNKTTEFYTHKKKKRNLQAQEKEKNDAALLDIQAYMQSNFNKTLKMDA